LEIIDRLVVKLQLALSEFLGVLSSPKADPDKTAVVIVAALVGSLLLTILILALISQVRKYLKNRKQIDETGDPEILPDPEPESEAAPAPILSPAERWISGIIAVSVVMLSMFLGSIYTAQPNFCANCHTMETAYNDWEKSTHKETTCNACHSRPGATGYLIRQLDFAGESLGQLKGTAAPTEAKVSNAACLRCHQEIRQKTVKTKELLVRHQDFLENGAKCGDCHVSHKQQEERVSSMSQCIVCHDGKEAPRECSTCHRRDTALSQTKRHKVKSNIKPLERCDGCHATDNCSSHHGTEMPHQLGWFQEHGKIAAASDEPTCWRCHERKEYAFCQRCHTAVAPHNVKREPVWFDTHQFVVRDGQPYGIKDCTVCHDVAFCSACHDQDADRVFGLIRKSSS
jgi:cytochrome c nitrite reductase small subunit